MRVKILKVPKDKEKQQEVPEQINPFAKGGYLNINSARKTFKDKADEAGMTVGDYANYVLSNTRIFDSGTVAQARNTLNNAVQYAFGGNMFDVTDRPVILQSPYVQPRMRRFDNGGEMGGYHTNGADWQAPGNFNVIGTGGTHEQNANEGVQQGVDNEGTPNLVEENEVVYNDYVFSNRLRVPKTPKLSKKKGDKEISDVEWERKMLKPYEGMTYADAAQKANKMAKERPNDPVTRRGLEVILGVLAGSQEKERAKKEYADAAADIDAMSGEEFMMQQEKQRMMFELAKQQQQQQMAQEQQAQQEQMPQDQMAQQQMQEQQMQQAQAEQAQQQAMQEQAMQQQAMQQQQQQAMMQQAAYGGNIRAYGGGMQEEEEELTPEKALSMYPTIAQYVAENKGTNELMGKWFAKLQEVEQSQDDNQRVAYVINFRRFIKDLQAQEAAQQQQAAYQQQMAQQQAAQQQYAEDSYDDSGYKFAFGGFKKKVNKFLNGGDTNFGAAWNNAGLNELTDEELLSLSEEIIPRRRFENPEEFYGYLENMYSTDNGNFQKLLAGSIADAVTESSNRRKESKTALTTEQSKELPKPNTSTTNTPTAQTTEPAKKELTDKDKKKAKQLLDSYYRSRKVNPSRLEGDAYKSYERDLEKVYEQYNDSKTFSINNVEGLYIKDERFKGNSDKNLQLYKDSAEDWYLENQGYHTLDLDDNGNVTWADPGKYLTEMKYAEDFWTDHKNYTEENGIYGFVAPESQRSSEFYTGDDAQKQLEDYYRSRLIQYYQDNNFSPNQNKNKKSTDWHDWTNASLREDGHLRKFVDWLSRSDSEQDRELAEIVKANWGTKDTPWDLSATWKLDKDKNDADFISESEGYRKAVEADKNPEHDAKFKEKQLDAYPGVKHIPYLSAWTTPGSYTRYYYIDPRTKQKVYVARPDEKDFKLGESKTSTVNGMDVTEIQVMPNTKNRRLYKSKSGKIWDVSDGPMDQWIAASKAYNDADPYLGYKGNSSWVQRPYEDYDPFPKMDDRPYKAAALMQALGLGYNVLSPVNHKAGNAIIEAAKNAKQKEIPIDDKPIGVFQDYKPLDEAFLANNIRAAHEATNRILANQAAGNFATVSANTMANDTNYINSLGEAIMKARAQNDERRNQIYDFNRETEKFNSENYLKRNIAQAENAAKNEDMYLNALAKGYALNQEQDNARGTAINASLSGLANLALTMEQNRYNQDVMGWGMRHDVWRALDAWEKNKNNNNTTAEGGLLKIRRSRKGLSF